MAYGTTLDSLNDAILREGMANGQREDSFRNYLLGLAGERNRGRQVDVNAMDAGTRREGLGVQERLGNRQWDTEGRRVDALGREIDVRDRLGGRQWDTEAERIRAMERMNEKNAGVTGKYYEAMANPRKSEAAVLEEDLRRQNNRRLYTMAKFVVDEANRKFKDQRSGFLWGGLERNQDMSTILSETAERLGVPDALGVIKMMPDGTLGVDDVMFGAPADPSPRPPAPVPQPAPTPAPQPGPVADVLTPPAKTPPASRPIQPGVVAHGGFGLPPRRSDPSTNAPPGRQVRRLVILPDGTTALE